MQLVKHWAATLDDYAIDLAWSPQGAQLAAASAAGAVSLFDAKDGAVRHALPGHDDGANCLAWHPAGESLATGAAGRAACVSRESAASGAEADSRSSSRSQSALVYRCRRSSGWWAAA